MRGTPKFSKRHGPSKHLALLLTFLAVAGLMACILISDNDSFAAGAVAKVGDLIVADAGAADLILPELSPQSIACIDCHKKESAAAVEQWGSSRHYRANIGCFECHSAHPGDEDAYMHHGERIATIVSPKDCSTCHSREVASTASRCLL